MVNSQAQNKNTPRRVVAGCPFDFMIQYQKDSAINQK